MNIVEKQWSVILPASCEEAWDFFSRPENLNEITPPDMHFQILSAPIGHEMYAGMIISYRIKPFPFYSTKWITEITHVKKNEYFVDEQRFGPYTFWHHQHLFQPHPKGVLMNDILHYVVPFGPLGSWLNKNLISSRIDRIFAYREDRVKKIFFKSKHYVNTN